MLPFALAPFFYWPLSIMSLGLLLMCLQGSSPKEALLRGWLFGLAKFGVGVSWVYVSMHDHGGTPALLAILMTAVWAAFLATTPALFIYIFQRYYSQNKNPNHNSDHGRITPLMSILAFASLWFFYEWCRSWFLTGFPWLFVGDAHLHSWLSGWAPVLSVYGLSFLSALSAGALYYAWRQRQPWLLSLLIVWPIGFTLQQVSWTHPQGTLSVSAVQGNVAQDIKWLPAQRVPTFNLYEQQTDSLWGSDVILWPETALPMLKHHVQNELDRLSIKAEQHHSALITGIPFRYQQGPFKGAFHNSILAIGTGSGLYHKQKLVPFGEYIPFADVIRGLLPFFDLPMSSFKQGASDQALLSFEKDEQRFLIAPFICYEIVYPQFVADMAANADLLITVSNDAWFGDSLGPKQHMAIAQMRALETGRYVLRSTNTGTTALVDNRGQIVAQLATNQRATLTSQAVAYQGLTPFMRLGLWPLLIFSASMLLLGLALRRKESVSREEGKQG